MRNTYPLTITLPQEMAAMVKSKVASGEYASESEVIRDGLRTLQARDAAMEKWLREDVANSYDEHAADSSKAVEADELLARVRASHRTQAAKQKR